LFLKNVIPAEAGIQIQPDLKGFRLTDMDVLVPDTGRRFVCIRLYASLRPE